MATGYLPEPKMPEMIPNSLRKGLNGGEPVMAKNPARKSPPVRGEPLEQPPDLLGVLGPVGAMDVPGGEEENPLGQAIVDDVEERTRESPFTHPQGNDQYPHMLHAGVGQHPFEV